MALNEVVRERWYREAFQRWWNEDYSWDGLAKKKITNEQGSQSLQQYWRNEEQHLRDFAGRKWTSFHLPPHDIDGTIHDLWAAGARSRFHGEIAAHFQGGVRAYSISSSPDLQNRPVALLQGVVFHERVQGIPNNEIAANFTDAIFLTGDQFKDRVFTSPLIFPRALFADDAIFVHPGASTVDFSDATIFGALVFHSNLGGRVSCANLRLGGPAKFGTRNLVGPLDFRGAHFEDECDFSGDGAIPGMRFDGATFRAGADFSNRTFTRPTSFAGAKFHDLALFYGARLHKNTSFVRAKFDNAKSGRRSRTGSAEEVASDARAAEFESAFRVLREHAVSRSNHEDEGNFYALELDARIQRSDVPPFEKLIARLFALTSSYGRDALRPWIWWAGSVSVFTLVAALFVKCTLREAKPPYGTLLATVIGQFVPLPSAWQAVNAEGKMPTWLFKIRNDYPLEFGIFSTAAALVTIGLLGVFLVTLRRSFALK